MLLEDTTPERAVRVGHQLVRAVAEAYEHEALKLFPGVSAGISAFPATGSDAGRSCSGRRTWRCTTQSAVDSACVSSRIRSTRRALEKLELLADFRSGAWHRHDSRPTSSRSSMPSTGASSHRARRSFAGITRPPRLLTPISFLSVIARRRPIERPRTLDAAAASWTSSNRGPRADCSDTHRSQPVRRRHRRRRLMDWLLVRAGRASTPDSPAAPLN